MQTQTHYVDGAGQHYLPMVLQNRTINEFDVIVSEDDMDLMEADEYQEVKNALVALGIYAELDDRGALVAVEVAE